MSNAHYSHQHCLFEKHCEEEAAIGVRFGARTMPPSRKKGLTEAFLWGPCEQGSPAALAAEARSRVVVIYCYMSNGTRLVHHVI